MPELPEVETIARTLDAQITGRVIDAAHILSDGVLQAGKKLVPRLFPGAEITAVSRRGKLLLLELGPHHLLAFHLKMTGGLFVYGGNAAPGKHTRMVFALAASKQFPANQLFFDDIRKFGYCRLMVRDELSSWPFWAALGPEPLSLGVREFTALFKNRKRAVKALLLDQGVIAGIGNIYADEACFRAGAHPAKQASQLDAGERKRLFRALQTVLREAIAECGSSIRNYRDAFGNSGAFQNRFRVYGRGGQACVQCSAFLQKTVVAGRTTVFCPQCQQM